MVLEVYPRMRGGAGRIRIRNIRYWGLSPHARGSRCGRRRGVRQLGSIPACAGEPNWTIRCASAIRVYPRMRGGALAGRVGASGRWGLSPHARGSRKFLLDKTASAGSIPACAGEPDNAMLFLCNAGVYPRMRGGASDTPNHGDMTKGLSPHARGSPQSLALGFAGYRSIPACAGEPFLDHPIPVHFRVYPRMRGGADTAAEVSGSIRGLSPHARGSRRAKRKAPAATRSIPACAGEPYKSHLHTVVTGVYPRMRGGARYFSDGTAIDPGLSPHARGSLLFRPLLVDSNGSIPACAGEPFCENLKVPFARVYPRMRGGASLPTIAALTERGLSPHARGSP